MAIDEPKLTNEQLFMKWLSTQMPNGRVPDLHQVFVEVESFCKKLHILKQPLFDTFDYETIAKVRKTVEQNKIFTITHKKQMVLVRSGIHYYSIYIREGHYKSLAASQPRDAVQSAIDDALDSPLSQVQETNTSASSVERTPKHSPSDHVIPDPILPKEEQTPSNQETQSLSPEELVRKALKEETEKNNYGTTITFLNGVLHIPSQSIKAILDKAEWALYRYGRYFYVEPPESDSQRDSEQPASFSSGVTGYLSDMGASSAVDDGPSSVLPVDSLLSILTEKEISFIDMRGKGGKLWIIGDKSLQGATEELQKQGYSFRFCSGGSKSTDWRSSWYLDEEANIHMSASKETMQESPIGDRALSPELLQVLAGDDLELLRASLIQDNILTLEQLRKQSLWKYMNYRALYRISQRDAIYRRVTQRIKDASMLSSGVRYSLKTRSREFSGSTPAEAFASFCEFIALKYPLKIRTLLDAKCNEQGSVVLSRADQTGDSIKIMNPVAYINKSLSKEAAIAYGHWICRMCGEDDCPVEIVEQNDSKPVAAPAEDGKCREPAVLPPKGNPASDKTAAVGELVSTGDVIENDAVVKAERIVLQADLDGLTIEELSVKLQSTMIAAKRVVSDSQHIVQLGDKLIHEEAFVDWEDGADQLESILEKLLDRNDGYVSASQLFDFAHAEMQMFLNDNDMDDARLVFDMAQHLFEKVGYHNKRYSFQSKAHISRSDQAVTNALDLFRNYAVAQGGVFEESGLVQYLQNVGVKTGNLRLLMKVYTQPIFLFYDKGQFVYGDSMGFDDEWFSTANKALTALFDDMGDHMVLRDIQPWWFTQLPALPAGKPWTLLLLQSVLFHYSEKLNGAHTISAMSGQGMETLHAMLVSRKSEIQTFADAVIAFLVDEGIEQRYFEAEELRQKLVQRGLIAGNELIWNMPKALAGDPRFAWEADGQHVSIKV